MFGATVLTHQAAASRKVLFTNNIICNPKGTVSTSKLRHAKCNSVWSCTCKC